MSELRTDFKDEILQEGETHRVYNIKRKGTDEVVESEVYLEKAYEPLQEGTEFGAKDVNEIHGRLNGLAPRNLLINGDFQVNQRGQSEYVNIGSNAIYTLDMWYLLWGTVTKLSKGIRITPGVPTGYIQQKIMNEINSNSVTICIKVDGNIYTVNGTVSQIENIILENEKFNVVFQYETTSSLYKINIVVKEQIDLEYIDLFEGDIAYPHVIEDYAIALNRCRWYLVDGSDVATVRYAYDGSTSGTFFYLCTIKKPRMAHNNPTIKTSYMYYNSDGTSSTGNCRILNVYTEIINFYTQDGKQMNDRCCGVTVDYLISCEPL